MNNVTRLALLILVLAITPAALAKKKAAVDKNDAKVERNDAAAEVIRIPKNLEARKPLIKRPTAELEMPDQGATGRLIVKFTDATKARIQPGGALASLSSVNVKTAQDIITGLGLEMSPAIRLNPEKITRLESRAAAFSGKAQPDLGGLMYVSGPEDLIKIAAKSLNGLPEVEFVQFELTYKVGEPGPAPTGRCCLCDGSCVLRTQPDCENNSGVYGGDGTLCTGGCQQPGTNPLEDGACCYPTQSDPMNCIAVGVNQEECENNLSGQWFPGAIRCECAGSLGGGCPPLGACCLASGLCQSTTEAECPSDAFYFGDGTNCILDDLDCEFEGCGAAASGSCFECNSSLYCDELDCCNEVCRIDPFCCEEDTTEIVPGRNNPPLNEPQWDRICVNIAFRVCGSISSTAGGGAPYEECMSPDAAACYESHETPGCSPGSCCETVCNIRPSCCTTTWDATCASIALDLCYGGADPSPTPSLCEAQGYLVFDSYERFYDDDNDPLTPSTLPPILDFLPYSPHPASCNLLTGGVPAVFFGYGGDGMDLDGLWEFGKQLIELGVEGPNLARGKSINVGVIEHTAFVDWQDPARTHEDLRGKVIAEEGQTILLQPTASNALRGNHGTACLGIIGAIDHGKKGHSSAAIRGGSEVGIVGMAPDANLHFFPTVSVEQPGGRLLDAIASALDRFGPGDVLSFSIDPDVICNNEISTLVSTEAEWMMIRMATDAGITSVIMAGNECCNVDSTAQFNGQDSGAIIVGAVSPGFPFCRLGFSNFCQSCDVDEANTVHTAAWGSSVATLGYGDMFNGDDPENANGYLVRSYTNSFRGTSAAAPQIASVVACTQGIAKMLSGIPAPPETVRFVVSRNGDRQCSIADRDDVPGSSPEDACFGDHDFSADANSVAGVNNVAYPDPVLVADELVRFPLYDDSRNIDDFVVIRGDLTYGNINSIRADDQSYLVIESEHTDRNHVPNLTGPAGQVAYFGTGQTVDVMIEAHTNIPDNEMSLLVDLINPNTTKFVIMLGQMYDWTLGKWTFVGLDLLSPPGLEQTVIGGVFNSQVFIHPDDDSVLIRLYVLAIGKGRTTRSGIDNPFTLRVDLVKLEVDQGFGPGPN